MSLEIFSCHHDLAHHFLMGQSAASNTLFAFLQDLGCGGLFCGVHSLLLGHHLLKKYKWWGMPACNFLLAWPQTSDEQAGNVFGMPWLPLLGPQCPFTPKGVTDSPGL